MAGFIRGVFVLFAGINTAPEKVPARVKVVRLRIPETSIDEESMRKPIRSEKMINTAEMISAFTKTPFLQDDKMSFAVISEEIKLTADIPYPIKTSLLAVMFR